MIMREVIKYIEASLHFHKKSSITLGNVKKYLKQGKKEQAQRSLDLYKKLADDYVNSLKDWSDSD